MFVRKSSLSKKTQATEVTPREAYQQKDIEASKAAHEQRKGHVETHRQGGEYVKSMVYGGLDGILEMFSIISAIVGSDKQLKYVPILGFASLVADAISMGMGDFLSERAGKYLEK